MRSAFWGTCCLLVMSGCSSKATSDRANRQWSFHTTPDKWKDVRVFHTAFDERWSERVQVRKVAAEDTCSEKIYSPNKAYWYSVAVGPQTRQVHDVRVDIFSERDYLVRLELSQIYMNFEKKVRWINEKLLYVRVWWGRALGADLIFDVETERIVYMENVHFGTIPFLQWQQAKMK